MTTHIDLQLGPITVLTLRSESGLNLLHEATMRHLLALLQQLSQDEQVQVLVLTGARAKAFCAGADIQELLALQDITAYVQLGEEVMRVLTHFPTPVLAALNGYALGAGFSLAMACELRLISQTAKIGQLAVRNGLVPPFSDTLRLTQAIGLTKAKELIYTGRILTAPEALDYGLVSRICAPEDLQLQTLDLAQTIAQSPGTVLRRVKQAINIGVEQGYEQGYLAQRQALEVCLADAQSQERLKRFFQNQ